MPLSSMPSFHTLDQAHYIATGEHLKPIAGDAAPHPVEYYVKRTQERQQRARLWELLDETLKGGDMVSVRPGVVNGTSFTHAKRQRDEIHLFARGKHVMILTPDGIEPPTPTPVGSPPPPFVLRTPFDHPAFELSNETLLVEHKAAKEEAAHAHEHLTAIQAAMRVRHVSKN